MHTHGTYTYYRKLQQSQVGLINIITATGTPYTINCPEYYI